jgi:hypothetical protein
VQKSYKEIVQPRENDFVIFAKVYGLAGGVWSGDPERAKKLKAAAGAK